MSAGCPTCHKTFRNRRKLKKHYQRVHRQPLPTSRGIFGVEGVKGKRVIDEKQKFQGGLAFPDDSSKSLKAPTILTVGKSDEMFETIQSAVNYAKPSEDRPYTLLISGGQYHENLIEIESGYIHLFGLGFVHLTSDFAPALHLNTSDGYVEITNLFVHSPSPSLRVIGSDFRLSNSSFDTIYCADFTADMDPVIFNCNFGHCSVNSLVSSFEISNCTIRDIRTGNIDDLNFYGCSGTVSIRNTSHLGQLQSQYSELTIRCSSYDVYDNTGSPTRSPIEIEPYGSNQLFLHHCTLRNDGGVPSISRIGSSGTIEVWTSHNVLTSAYGPNVNENLATTYNIIDPSF